MAHSDFSRIFVDRPILAAVLSMLLLIAGAVLFGRFLTVSRLPFELAEWAAALPVAPFVILLVVLGIYIIGGMLMDALGFLVVTIPIFFPLGVALGYDPVWYTVILTIITTMGAVTPGWWSSQARATASTPTSCCWTPTRARSSGVSAGRTLITATRRATRTARAPTTIATTPCPR